jgi:hypothetical protein
VAFAEGETMTISAVSLRKTGNHIQTRPCTSDDKKHLYYPICQCIAFGKCNSVAFAGGDTMTHMGFDGQKSEIAQ